MGETVVIWFSVVVSLEVKIQRDWSATPCRSQFATRRVLAYIEVLCNVLPRALGRTSSGQIRPRGFLMPMSPFADIGNRGDKCVFVHRCERDCFGLASTQAKIGLQFGNELLVPLRPSL
jgi:hypothetical protein